MRDSEILSGGSFCYRRWLFGGMNRASPLLLLLFNCDMFTCFSHSLSLPAEGRCSSRGKGEAGGRRRRREASSGTCLSPYRHVPPYGKGIIIKAKCRRSNGSSHEHLTDSEGCWSRRRRRVFFTLSFAQCHTLNFFSKQQRKQPRKQQQHPDRMNRLWIALAGLALVLLGTAESQSSAEPVECSVQDTTFELRTGYVFTSPEEILDTRPDTLQLSECIDACRDNSSCAALNFETGLCVLFRSNALESPGEF